MNLYFGSNKRIFVWVFSLLFFSIQANAATPYGLLQQQKTITGTVTDAAGNPLANVSVSAPGSSFGTLTNEAGYYEMKVPDNVMSIEFSLIGYTTVTRAVSSSVINVALEIAQITGEEVIVTGYSSYRRQQSANAATVVNAEQINRVPMTPDQILQGRVPGLNVAAVSGQPGASAKVTLRGVGTIMGSTSVLYVVDGVPVEGGYFQAINPGDIENITVLKDASAKALYGSRGSNGVIVITTKKGKAGKVDIGYKSQYGLSTQTSPKFRMMTGAEHLLFEEQVGLQTGAANSGPGWTYSPKNPAYADMSQRDKDRADFILDSLRSINTDWRKFFFQQGKFVEQQIDASGGSEKVKFYTSLNYYDQDGIAKRSDLTRVTFRNNLDITTGKFSANFNVGLGYSASSFIESEGGSSGQNPLAAVYYALGYEYPFYNNAERTLVHPGITSQYPVMDTREGSTALERMLNTSNKTNQFKTLVGMALSYEFFKGFTAKTRVGVDFRNSLDQNYINPDSYSGSRVTNGKKGSFSEAMRRNYNVISTSGFSYARNINNLHDFDASLLYEYLYNQYRAFGYTGYGIDGRLPETPAGITPGSATGFIPTISGGRTKSAMSSFIGLARYTFNRKYTANLSYRYDGSSTLPAENRWHGFYSLGLNWDVKREAFLADNNFVNALNLRVSHGTTASPFSSDFGYLATYGATSYGGITGIRPITPGNKDYDWEYAEESNAGLNLSVLQSRIRLTADLYKRLTKNLFFDLPQSITSGFYSNRVNTGNIENKGVELDLQADVLKLNGLSWTIGGNIAINNNKILSLGENVDSASNGYSGILIVGMPLGTHWAPHWAGVNPETGAPQYYSRDGKITETYNATDLSVAKFGTYLPKITGGFNTGFNFREFYVNALFSYAFKVMRYNNEDYYNENPSFRSSNQSVRMLYDRWQKPGDIAILPTITATRRYTSRDIQDASFVRFRNLSVGYNVPSGIIEGLRYIKGVHVFMQGQNLYTWTKWRGFDPENGNEYNRFAYPTPRTFTIGLNLNF